jgi:hypothetical protein
MAGMTEPKSQTDKFREAARELECDDDDTRFKERVGKLVKHKPVEKPEPTLTPESKLSDARSVLENLKATGGTPEEIGFWEYAVGVRGRSSEADSSRPGQNGQA